MKRTRWLLTVGILAVCLIAGVGQSATFSLSGPGQTGNTITVAPGATFTVNALMNAPENGNTFEVFLGFDVSSQTSPGLGGTPTLNKLVLTSATTAVEGSIDAGFVHYRRAKIATAREASNSALGGRAYGLKVVAGRNGNTAGGTKTLFSATFQNNLPAGQSYAIVISDAGSGASYTTGWKSGITTHRGSYVLTVTSAAPSLHPGDANGDGKVDVSDLGILAANYGTTSGAAWDKGDFNDDDKVDVSDLGILAANYGFGTGAALDFNADAKAAGLLTDDVAAVQKEEQVPTPTLGCGSVGLPLVAGFLLAGGLLAVGRKLT